MVCGMCCRPLYVINVNVWYVGMCDVCWYVVCRGAGVSGVWYGVCMCVVCMWWCVNEYDGPI